MRTDSLILNLTPEVRDALVNLLTVAGRLEDYAHIVDHLPDKPYGDLNKFLLQVYDPLRLKQSVTGGRGEDFSLELKDVDLVFGVLKGMDDGVVGGTPWKAMSPAERVAVDRFLEELCRPLR